jgi:hypothetical protein
VVEESIQAYKKIVCDSGFLVLRGAHLARVVKSNSSGIKVWSGSLVLTGLRSSSVLIEERLNIESTSTWIRGDWQVIDTTG